jgi:hypothetical protein
MRKTQSVHDSDAVVSRVVEASAAPVNEGHIKKNMSMLSIIGTGLGVSNGWSGISGEPLISLI